MKTKFLVPFEVETSIIESQLQDDAAKKVIDRCYEEFDAKLNEFDKRSRKLFADERWHESDADRILSEKVDAFLSDHSEEIIDKAAKRLSDLLAKRKVARELVERDDA